MIFCLKESESAFFSWKIVRHMRRRSRFRIRTLSMIAFSALYIFTNQLCGQTFDQLIDSSLEYAKSQLEAYLSEQTVPGNYPYETSLDNHRWVFRGKDGWASGYFIGSLWLMYQYHGDESWRSMAALWTKDMSLFGDNEPTDLAVRIFYSAGFCHRLTGDSSCIEILERASNSLSGFYSDQVKAIQCFPTSWSQYNFCVVTDFLLHMELLLYTYALTGRQSYLDIALHHTLKTLNYNMRENGSFYHVSDFDDSGELTGYNQGFIQGYNLDPDSLEFGTWSRGQAWAVRALPIIHHYTGDTLHLNMAKKAADYVIDNFPVSIYGDDDYVPYSDYFPDRFYTGNGKDASAASIACAGLYDLANLTDETKYKTAADSILRNLCTKYITKDDPNNYASILKRTMHRYGASERGHIFADHFFIESLLLAKGYEIYKPVDMPSGLKEPVTGPVTCWPNPVNDLLFFNTGPDSVNDMLVIYNLYGKVVLRKQVTRPLISIDFSQFPSGMYLISVNGKHPCKVNRVIKQ